MEHKDELTINEIWKELEDGDETRSVSAGLLVGELIAAIISARHKCTATLTTMNAQCFLCKNLRNF